MRSGQLLQNLGLALASLCVTLLLAEIGVRLTVGPPTPRNFTLVPKSIRTPSPFPGIPYLLAPGSQAVHDFGSNPRGYFDGDGTLTYHINSVGLRDREVTREKPPGTFRILGIGDSFTFGTGVRREHLFLTRLQKLLDADGRARPIQVLNLGIMGFNSAHEVALLRHVGLDFEPDLVLLVYVLNDARVWSPTARPAAEQDAAPAFPSLLWQHLRARLDSPRVSEEAIRRTLADHRPNAPGFRRVQRSLREARDLARARGFALAVVIFPVMWQLDDDYPFAPAHEAVTASARHLGIPVLDLLDAFRGQDGPSLWVHPANQHPNERAHQIAAAAIHDWLGASGLLETD